MEHSEGMVLLGGVESHYDAAVKLTECLRVEDGMVSLDLGRLLGQFGIDADACRKALRSFHSAEFFRALDVTADRPDCVIWPHSMVWVNGDHVAANRAAYEHHHNTHLEQGVQVTRTCRDAKCVAKAHLVAATPSDLQAAVRKHGGRKADWNEVIQELTKGDSNGGQ